MNENNPNSVKSYLTARNIIILAILLMPIVLTFTVFFGEDSSEYTAMGNAVYGSGPNTVRCEPGSRNGDSGATYGESTLDGIKYNVRTPMNYKATVAHPLIVVYSPAGSNRAKTEKMTHLTMEATSAGYIIAYADHPELSPTSTIELGTIPGLISKKWCIDNNRIFLTGHSDGGTASMALAFMAGTKDIPTAIAPSAAGIHYNDLYNHECPEPISVMVMHSENDHLFPGYGVESSGWWAACNQCSPIPDELENGCISYPGCKNGVTTWYCEGSELHAHWPGINSTIIEFFSSSSRSNKLQK